MGGHTELILRASPDNRVIGFDRDAEAIALASERLSEFGERFTAAHTDYRRIKEFLAEKGIETVAGILADLGVSSYQLNAPERGFSFRSGQDFTKSPSSSVNFTKRSIRILGGYIPTGYADGSFTKIDSGRFN